ncbi:MAG: MFS transporter [Rhodospirillales bacterium]
MVAAATLEGIETDIPARLDRLPWSRFHWLVVLALGITWILDGLEVTIAAALTGALQDSPSLRLTPSEVGLSASAYLAGAVLGAAFFGWLTDRLGRKRLFNITLGVYLVATAASAFAWDLWSFVFFRFLTGAGIGGEYTAINSAIQELIPARMRGWTDLAINGSFWVGAAMGAAGSLILLDPALFGVDLGWRLAFGIGAVLGLGILYLRRFIPESPRWLMTHVGIKEADVVVRGIEARVAADHGPLPPPEPRTIRIRPRGSTALRVALATIFVAYRRRAILGFVLMVAQAFFYNAVFFSYGLILRQYYAIPAERIGLYLLPFAVGNFLGPLLLGPLFDSIGRKPMIAFTYAASGVLLAATAWLFARGALDATGQTIAWMVIFFFASAAASSAYLTVSESFPLEVRAFAIALFYLLGTATGGVAGPWLFGRLVEAGSRADIVVGYLFGAALMVGAAIVALALGIRAERRPLEAVAAPLSRAD